MVTNGCKFDFLLMCVQRVGVLILTELIELPSS